MIQKTQVDRSAWNSPKEIAECVAVDFETYYDDEVSLREMNPYAYVFHPQTAPYLVAFKGPDWEWCGDPRDFAEWHRLDGKLAVAHNASFDALVWRRAQKDGIIPADCNPARWACTADLAAYLRVYRSLQNTVKQLYGENVSKEYRHDAKGKTREQLKADPAWPRIVAAGGVDAHWSRRVASDHLADWPVKEQAFSEWNREAAWRGFATDAELVEAGFDLLSKAEFENKRALPWYPDDKPLSPIAFRRQARAVGIKAPASLAKGDEKAQEFYAKYADEFPWVRAYRDYRQANTLLKKVETLRALARPDGTAPYQSVYFGAHSGRLTAGAKRRSSNDDSGEKFNLYNLPKGELQGVNLRHMIVPRKGHKFIIADFSQVEARLLLAYAGDTETINLIREGYNIYEARATQLLGLKNTKGLKHSDPATYAMVKALVLGAGYQMGWKRFMQQAPVLTGGAYRPTEKQAREAIFTFRNKSPLITQFWFKHQMCLTNSATQGDATHRVQLKSGRWITYFDPHFETTEDPDTGKPRTDIYASMLNGEQAQRLFAGRITENIMQATGYDVLSDCVPKIEELDDCRVVFTIYDEVVAEVPEKNAQEYGEEISRLMTTSSPWLGDCPLETEWGVHDRYTK